MGGFLLLLLLLLTAALLALTAGCSDCDRFI
jgi:hypothetical protein